MAIYRSESVFTSIVSCPITSISDHGIIISSSCPKSPKARGLPGAYVALFKKIEELGGINPRFASLAGYTVSTREVAPIQTYLADNLGLPEPLVRQIGCVIGTHAGPGAFGLAFFDNGLIID